MGKRVDDTVMDGAFAVTDNAIRQAVCTAEPANFAGIAAVRLAEATMAPGDFVTANGDTSGRKVTVGAKLGVSITTSGNATHLVLHDNVSVIQAVTTCTLQALVAGGTVDIPAWKEEIQDPT